MAAPSKKNENDPGHVSDHWAIVDELNRLEAEKIATARLAQAGGVATLGSDGKVLTSQLPAAQTGGVTTVAGRSGAVVLGVADVSGAVASSDSRLSDARSPLAHTHTRSAITDLGTAAGLNVAASGQAGNNEVVKGDDARLSNPRTPASHKASHATGGTDALLPADIGAIAASEKGAASGVATLDGTGKVPSAQIPASAGGMVGQAVYVSATAPSGASVPYVWYKSLGAGAYERVVVTGLVFAPSAPLEVAGTLNGTGSIALRWTRPGDSGGGEITGYRIEQSTDTGATWTTATADTGSNALSGVVNGLTNGTAYVFRVTAKNSAGFGSASDRSHPVTPAVTVTVAGAPTGLTATGGDTQATLAFTAPASNGGASITAYGVQYSTDAGTTWLPSGADLATGSGTVRVSSLTSLTPTVTGLTNGSAVIFRVRAVNSAGNGSYSSNSNSVTPAGAVTVPGAPTTLAATQVGTGSASAGGLRWDISWAAPGSNGGSAITGYTVERFDGTNWVSVGTTGGSATTLAYTVPQALYGTSVQLRVRAANSVGSSANSTTLTQTAWNTPATPSAPTSSVSGQTISLSWTAPTNNGTAVVDYKVEVSTNAGSTWADVTGSPFAGTSASLTGQSAGTYVFRVSARNAVGLSSVSTSSSSVTVTASGTAPSGTPFMTGMNSSSFSGLQSAVFLAPGNSRVYPKFRDGAVAAGPGVGKFSPYSQSGLFGVLQSTGVSSASVDLTGTNGANPVAGDTVLAVVVAGSATSAPESGWTLVERSSSTLVREVWRKTYSSTGGTIAWACNNVTYVNMGTCLSSGIRATFTLTSGTGPVQYPTMSSPVDRSAYLRFGWSQPSATSPISNSVFAPASTRAPLADGPINAINFQWDNNPASMASANVTVTTSSIGLVIEVPPTTTQSAASDTVDFRARVTTTGGAAVATVNGLTAGFNTAYQWANDNGGEAFVFVSARNGAGFGSEKAYYVVVNVDNS